MGATNFEYVVVDVNGNFTNVYGFCTLETAQEIIDKATNRANENVKTYNSHIVNFPEQADYWNTCKKQYEHAKYEMMTYDEYLKRQKEVILSNKITEITKEEFDEALNVLPPLKFCTRGNIEMFCIREMYTGTYTTQYAYNLVNEKCYSAIVDVTDETTWINHRL